MSERKYAHWGSTGAFRVKVAGVSHYRSAIEAIAQNPLGTPALVICLAHLEIDNANHHDPNAVRVLIRGQMVGHLSADYAKLYRGYLSNVPEHLRNTSVSAAITGGLRTKDRAYEYTVELDIPEDLKLHLLSEPVDDDVVRAYGYARLVESAAGVFSAKVWIPTADLGELDKELSVQEWTTDTWDTVNYYVENRQGIGLGLKLYELPKSEHARLFGGQPTDAKLELGKGRFGQLFISAQK